MAHTLFKDYFPFGSQYYRAPSPDAREWEKDLKHMAGLGFNMVKFWVQWRWNHPLEDRYYFEDIDRLMDIAADNQLRVMLNTIFDVAPAWIYTKYPGASMVTLGGKNIGPQTQPHRQIGGLGYCLNHPEVTGHQFRFLAETIKRYKQHPALEIWNIGSEPELTSSMAEMRLYADNADKMDDMLCFCPNCLQAFPNWLEKKYKTIEELNLRWNRNYRSFSDIEVPVTRNTFNDMIDWRMFFVDTLGENVRRRFEIAAEHDKGEHLLMCHHVFIQGFPLTSTANDPWNVGQFGDLHGFTQMDDPMMIDILRSCAKDKPVISAEMLMLPGYTLDLPRPVAANDIKRFVFSGVAGNLKGFIFWQFRPEILGREAPAWGLSYLDGSLSPCLKSYAQTGKILTENAGFLLQATPRPAEAAIIYHPENQIFAWIATKNEKSATDSLLGMHRALYERNFNIDFIHPREFDGNILENYKLIITPFPYVLGEKICSRIAEWVRAGGILISESYMGGWQIEEGHHATVIPGYGLHTLFKIRHKEAWPLTEKAPHLFSLNKDLPYLKKGSELFPYLISERIFNDGAEVLATYQDGEAAVTLAEAGKGKAIYVTSFIGLHYYRKNDPASAGLIAGLAELAGIIKPLVSQDIKVRVDILADASRQMLIVQNLEEKHCETEITLPEKMTFSLKEQFSKEILNISAGIFKIKLAPREVKVFL